MEECNQSLIGHGFREISNRSDEDRISIKMEKTGRNVYRLLPRVTRVG